MKLGFSGQDITPRVGVPLAGFGPFLNRVSNQVRDRLWARAMAVEADDRRAVVVACDLINIALADTQRVQAIVHEATGLPGEALMLHCSHTHSGPDTIPTRTGWGGCDEPYMELLPRRIAAAAIGALSDLGEAALSHAEVPCEGIGLNRVYDIDAPPLDEVLADDWRPAKPELTDTTCHVLKAERDGALIGFVSYFGCHPVCCCADTHAIHGDFVGVATGMLQRENPGAIGMFLQGAQGDVNSCVVHKPEREALEALDIIAARYARSVRAGLAAATPIDVDTVRYSLREAAFSHQMWSADELRTRLADEDAVIGADNAGDEDAGVRMAVVRASALRRLLAALERGDRLDPPTQVQGIRIGPISLLAAPLEIFQAIKNDVVSEAASPIPLVMGLTNDSRGYAPDRTDATKASYAAAVVPMIHGRFPYANIHDELAGHLIELDTALNNAT